MLQPYDILLESSTSKYKLGDVIEYGKDGRKFMYCKANEALKEGAIVTPMVALFDGDCDASSGNVLNDAAVTFTAGVVGGYVQINAGTASILQKANKILSYSANQLVLEDDWGTALTTSEDYVVFHPHLVEECDAAGEVILGVTPIAVTSGYYFWLQVQGFCPKVLTIGSTDPIVANEGLVSSTTAGLAKGLTAAGTTTDEAEKSNITAIMPTALAAGVTSAYLRCLH